MFVGIDGCHAGWFAIALHNDNKAYMHVFPNIQEAWNLLQADADLILIDIPIGLREAGIEERHCDTEARQILGWPRRTSVFPVPCRQATRADTYDEANEINIQRTGRGISLPTWGILPKIRQVDSFLMAKRQAQNVVREVHPEVCFWALSGKNPMSHNKKTPGGLIERIAILQRFLPNAEQIFQDALANYPRAQVQRDDVVDAMVAAITARMRKNNRNEHSLPVTPEFEHGLRMEMIYAL